MIDHFLIWKRYLQQMASITSDMMRWGLLIIVNNCVRGEKIHEGERKQSEIRVESRSFSKSGNDFALLHFSKY
jgi:hypothetical protein